MVLKNGELYMPYGSAGNDIQPQAMVQTLLNLEVFGMDPQSAVEAPRIGSYSYLASSEPHAYHPGRLNLEAASTRRPARRSRVWGTRSRGGPIGLGLPAPCAPSSPIMRPAS